MAERRPGDRPNGAERRAFTPPLANTAPRTNAPVQRLHASTPASRSSYRIPIPRSQKWLFWIMLLLVVAMSVYLIRLRERAGDRFAAAAQPLPLSAADTHEAPLRLYLANDADGSLAEKPLRFPLPSDPNARARVVLEKLLAEYTAAGSPHPLSDKIGTGVEEVYLLPIPGLRTRAGAAQPLLAVVNLTTSLVQNHPSGIEPETLTLLSMIATLSANLPQVAQVRFVVDGQQQATLAGHADLTRTYLAAATQMTTGTPPGEAEAPSAWDAPRANGQEANWPDRTNKATSQIGAAHAPIKTPKTVPGDGQKNRGRH